MAIENTRKYSTYSDFFPFYLSEHSKKSTRLLHYSGTIGYQVLFWSLIFSQNYLFLPLVLLAGYGPAWIGHFFYEKNKIILDKISFKTKKSKMNKILAHENVLH